MASKAKVRPKRKNQAPNPLADLGLFDIPNLDLDEDDNEGSDVDEASLENELAALMAGEDIGRKKRVPKSAPPPLDIETMAAQCLKDDDDEEDDDDDDLLSNEELLKELQKLSPGDEEEPPQKPPERLAEKRPAVTQEVSKNNILQQLEDRLKLYNDAIQAAKQLNDSSKARRYGRAVKTLESLIKSAKSGGVVNEEDIPPVVSIPKAPTEKKPENKPNSEVPDSVNNADQFDPNIKRKPLPQPPTQMDSKAPSSLNVLLTSRKNEYKMAALEAKKSGNKELAIKYMKTAKAFDAVIEAANSGQPVDLSNLPPPVSSGSRSIVSGAIPMKKTEEQIQNTSSPMEIAALAAANDEEQPAIFAAPPPPSTVLECLEQRLEKYKSTKQAAESEGNNGKVRRLQRIVKTYETAIKDYKAGRKIDYDDLPCPPGFAPFPIEGGSVSAPTIERKPQEPKEESTSPLPSAPTKKAPAPPQAPTRKPKVQRTTTFAGEKQLQFLLERQQLFRQAALSAKQEGNIQQAKEYLRLSKGFDNMLEAVKCGLPIDTAQIPTPPQLESSDFVIVDAMDCEESKSDLSEEELFETLLKDLTNQLEICRRNKEHFLRLGDVTSASKFEKLALESKKDLAVVQHMKKTDKSIPKFHYETRLFSMVVCNTDLADNELELTIERGINLPGKPDDLDSYVRIELPIPSEAPQQAKSHTIKDTNNPEFKETFKFEVNRKSRSQLRIFKRHSIKLEVWSKGGFLRSDKLLGTASVKLLDLESKCIVHDSYNLMEGRKNVGGSLEVKLRIREPLLTKQVEEVKEKWLVIGS